MGARQREDFRRAVLYILGELGFRPLPLRAHRSTAFLCSAHRFQFNMEIFLPKVVTGPDKDPSPQIVDLMWLSTVGGLVFAGTLFRKKAPELYSKRIEYMSSTKASQYHKDRVLVKSIQYCLIF